MFAATHTVDKSSPDCLPKQKLSTCFELGNNSCNSTPDKDVFSLAGARPNTNPTRDALEATHIHIPREVKMSQIADAMAYFIELIQNHLRYAGEGFDFNYESVAVEGFQHKGRGAVSIDISELVEPYINRENRCVEFLEKYVPLHTVSSSQEEEEESKQLAKVFQELVGAYNPETEYVVQLVIDSAKLPPTIPWDFPNKLLISVVVLDRTIGRKPTPLKKEQIRKRLNRMIQQGKRLLIADTSHPDFMGKNLEKWMRAVNDFQRQGKHISLIIDSEDNTAYHHLPDDLKSDVLPIVFK